MKKKLHIRLVAALLSAVLIIVLGSFKTPPPDEMKFYALGPPMP